MGSNSIEATTTVTPEIVEAALAKARVERAKAARAFFADLRRGIRNSVTGIFGAPAPTGSTVRHA